MSAPSPAVRRRRGVAIAALLAVVVAGAGGIWLVQRGEDDVRVTGAGPTPPAATSTPSAPGPETSSVTPPPPPSGSRSSSAAPEPGPTADDPRARMVRASDGWSYQVPQDASWRSARDVLAYVDRSGRVLVRATQPSYLNAGLCADPLTVARTSVGWAEPAAGDTAAAVAGRWASAVALNDDGSLSAVSRIRARPVVGVGGMTAEHATAIVAVPRGAPCLARRVEVSATSYRAANAQRVLVIVRDLGVRGSLPTLQKERLLRSVTHQP